MSIVVTAYKDGNIVRQSENNPEIGSIMVKDNSLKLIDGFISKNNTPAFIRGNLKDLQSLNLKNGEDVASKFGNKKIVIKERTTPFYEGQQQKINPKSGEIVLSNGSPVYRLSEVVDSTSTETDELLKSDNVTTQVNQFEISHEDIGTK